MRSLISEFSYGFALTHEFVLDFGNLNAAPIFPSLIEEGRSGGGYDVKLDAPGLPLFLQFKRSECLMRRSAREIKLGAPLSTPFYRFAITGSADSDQHDMLIALDSRPNFVFYAAPMFHQKPEFDEAFKQGAVRQRSFYVRPRDIGRFADDQAHHVSFDGSKAIVMSEPRIINAYGTSELAELFFKNLSAKDAMPLRDAISVAINAALEARRRVRPSGLLLPTASASADEITQAEAFKRRQETSLPPAPPPSASGDRARAEISDLADLSLRDFNSQLYIVQARE